ncbi:MAG: LysR family transcriptional regulator [Candidatus Nanopelagicales bacterium]
MELRQYRYFVAVAEELSFTKAAHRLSMAQPPLSQQIAKMERELGVRLFNRDHRHVTLTDAGEALLTECYALLEQEKRAREVVAAAGGLRGGRLRVGAMPSLLVGLLPGALALFRTEFPNVDVVAEELDDADQLERLSQQRLDLGLGRLQGTLEGFEITEFGSEPLVLAMPRDHRFADRRAVALRDFADDAFVMFRRSQAPHVYDTYLGACLRAGFQMRVSDESAVGDHSMLGLVACRRGIALVPLTTAQVRVPGVVFRRLSSPANACLPISLTWRRRAVPRFASAFARCLKSQLRETAVLS